MPAQIVQEFRVEGNNPVSLSPFFISSAKKGNKLLLIMSNSIVNSAYPLLYSMSPNSAYLSNFKLLGEQERIHIFSADIIADIPANTSFLSFTQTANNNYRSVYIQSYELAGVNRTTPFSNPVFKKFTSSSYVADVATGIVIPKDRTLDLILVNYTSPTVYFINGRSLQYNYSIIHSGAQGGGSAGYLYMINGCKSAPLSAQESTLIFPSDECEGENVILAVYGAGPITLVEVTFSASLLAQAAFTRQLSRVRGVSAALTVAAERIIDTSPSEPELIDSITYLEENSYTSYIGSSVSLGSSVSVLAQGFTGNGSYLEAAEFYLNRRETSEGEVVLRARIYQSVGSGLAFAEVGVLLAESEPLIFNHLSAASEWVKFVFVEPIKTVADTPYFVAIAAVSGGLSNNVGLDPRLGVRAIFGPSSELNGGEVWRWYNNSWNPREYSARGLLFRVWGRKPPSISVLPGFMRQLNLTRRLPAVMAVSVGVNRLVAVLRSFTAGGLGVAAGLARISVQLRNWSSKVSLYSSLSRQLSTVRQFAAGLKTAVDLSRFVSVLRNWSTQASLQAALTRRFRVFRGFAAKLGAAAALSQLSRGLYMFSAKLSLSADFVVQRIPVLRTVSFNAGLSVKSGFRRSVELTRRFISGLGFSAGVKRFVVVVRGFSVSASLTSLFVRLRFSVLREVVFNTGLALSAEIKRRLEYARQISLNLDVSAVLRRGVSVLRNWTNAVSVSAGLMRRLRSVRQFTAKLWVSVWFVRVFCVLRGFTAELSLDVVLRRGFVYVRSFAAVLGLDAVFMRVFGRLRSSLRVFELRKHPDIDEEAP